MDDDETIADLRKQLLEQAAISKAPQSVSLTLEMLDSIINRPKPAGADVAPVKKKGGWQKVLTDVQLALASSEVAPVIKLSRQNHKRLTAEAKADTSSRKIQLHDGASTHARTHHTCTCIASTFHTPMFSIAHVASHVYEHAQLHGLTYTYHHLTCTPIPLPGVSLHMLTDVDKAVPSYKDSYLWTGMSAFNRFFDIMANSTEEEFPRKAMGEFMHCWAEVWDSPLGNHAQKLDGMLAFYEKYASILGQGLWEGKFDSDSRFLLEHMKGENPAQCNSCAGTGENTGFIPKHVGASAPGAPPHGNTQNKPKHKPATGMCSSMLIKGKPCYDRKACTREHSPCPSCGGACTSATDCLSWDEPAVLAKYASVIERIQAAGNKRRRK